MALAIGAILMIVGGVVEIVFGVKAERRGLEGIAKPLTAVSRRVRTGAPREPAPRRGVPVPGATPRARHPFSGSSPRTARRVPASHRAAPRGRGARCGLKRPEGRSSPPARCG